MTVAIHQPNFCPWYPYFQKIQQADLFIIMIHCQFEKNNYQNRFENNGWNTMSVNGGNEPIYMKRYLKPQEDWQKITAKHPKLKAFDTFITDGLSITNMGIIISAVGKLGIKTEIKCDYATGMKGTARLVDICKTNKATKYLSGISGKKYLDLSLFEKEGIEVVFQDESEMIKKPLVEML